MKWLLTTRQRPPAPACPVSNHACRFSRFAALTALLCILGASAVAAQDSATVTITPVVPAARPRPRPKPKPRPKPPVVRPVTREVYSTMPGAVLLVDGKLIDPSSVEVVRGQHVMMSLREMEQLGWGTVEASGNSMLLRSRNIVLTFTKGSDRALLNSLVGPLPVKTYLKNTRLMVPLSFVAKALGLDFTSDVKVVVSVKSRVEPPPLAGPNALHGRVMFDGDGIKGVKVRAVGKDQKPVKGAVTLTDEDGMYNIKGLINGEYAAFVMVEDNPEYFTRSTDPTAVADGETAEMKPMYLGMIVRPVKPRAGSTVSTAGTLIDFAWTACDRANYYKFVVRKLDTGEAVVQLRSNEPGLKVSTSSFDTDTKYEAEVTAYNSSGEFPGGTQGSGGESWTFTTGSD